MPVNSGRILAYPAPGTFLHNVLIPIVAAPGTFHPHAVDFFIPNGTFNRCVISLHGAGGPSTITGPTAKQSNARAIGVTTKLAATLNEVRWSALEQYQVMVVIPQGQHLDGTVTALNPTGITTVSPSFPLGISTWSNHFMNSGYDDVQFLKDLKAYILTTYGLASNLCGHSNGAFMVNRMRWESPVTFTHYCSVSGMAPQYFVGVPLPALIRPYFAQIGKLDTVLGVKDGVNGIGDHFFDAILSQQPAQLSVADVTFPALNGYIGAYAGLQDWVTADGSAEIVHQADGVVSAGRHGTTITEWNYSTGRFKLQELSGADHGLISHTQGTGLYMIQEWLIFIAAT